MAWPGSERIREALDEEVSSRVGISATRLNTPRLLRPLREAHRFFSASPHQLQADPHRQIHLQMDRPSAAESPDRTLLDEQEGFRILMVKPGLATFDIIIDCAGNGACDPPPTTVSGEITRW